MLPAGIWIVTLGYAIFYKGRMLWDHYPSGFFSGAIGQAQTAGKSFQAGATGAAGKATAKPSSTTPAGGGGGKPKIPTAG